MAKAVSYGSYHSKDLLHDIEYRVESKHESIISWFGSVQHSLDTTGPV